MIKGCIMMVHVTSHQQMFEFRNTPYRKSEKEGNQLYDDFSGFTKEIILGHQGQLGNCYCVMSRASAKTMRS